MSVGELALKAITPTSPSIAVCMKPSLLSRPHLDPDRRAHKAKGVPDLVFEKTLVGEVEFHGAVGEEDERGRGDGSLSQVEDFHALAHGNGGAIEVDGLQETIHLAGGDALAAFAGHFLEQGEEFVDILAGRGRNKYGGSVIQEFQRLAEPLEISGAVVGHLAVWGRSSSLV